MYTVLGYYEDVILSKIDYLVYKLKKCLILKVAIKKGHESLKGFEGSIKTYYPKLDSNS